MMRALFVSALALGAPLAFSQEPVFSGPQPGESLKQFKALAITGAKQGGEVQAPSDAKGAVSIVFVHSIERSILPLLRMVDAYGDHRKDRISTTVVFLGEDRMDLENRLPLVAQSIKLKSAVLLSLDGAEGPGAYGLNKKCLMTIVAAKDGKVTANFALVQPGISDAPEVLKALAKTCGDENPPSAEELSAQLGLGSARDGMNRPMRGGAQELDLSKLDTSTPEAMRKAIDALIAEVRRLRAENAALRGNETAAERPNANRPGPIPGAAPTDPEMLSLLRRFIQPTNSDADVDKALKDMETRMKGDDGLTKQAVDGLVRVIYLKYGTEYAQKAGQAFVEKYKK